MESILGKGAKSNWFKDWVCDEIARGCNPTICVRFDHKIRVSDDFFDFLTRFYGMANSILLIVLMRPFLKPILRVWTAMKLASKSVYQYLMEAVWKKNSVQRQTSTKRCVEIYLTIPLFHTSWSTKLQSKAVYSISKILLLASTQITTLQLFSATLNFNYVCLFSFKI